MKTTKDEGAHQLARRLAAETGETLTQAVIETLRQRFARRQRQRRAPATAEELLAIGRRCAATLRSAPVDHAAFLYDERGLPR
jgi:antitoxin VapB